MQEQVGPQNTIQFLTMMITAVIKGLPQMIKSIIITSTISGVATLAAHFYLLLVPNDGYNSGNPLLTPILILADVQPTPPNVLLFWFLGNYLFWMVIGTFKEYGIIGGFKQFITTPLFAIKGLKESGFSAFPMMMGGLGFAFLLRLWILGTMTTIQMFLMMIGVLVSQSNSITLLGMRLFMTDIRKLVNRGKNIQPTDIGLPTTLVLGSIFGFAYIVFFPYNIQMVQILLALMVLGIIGMFVQGRRKGPTDQIALALMILCVFSLMALPVNADDGGAAETGGAIKVIENGPLRDKMIKQGIPASFAGIAAALLASGKLTPNIFNLLKTGKANLTKFTPDEIKTVQQIHKTIAATTPPKPKEPGTLKSIFTFGADIVSSFTPGVNDARDWYELTTGKDLIHGTDIGTFGRIMAGIGLIAGSGVALRKGGAFIKKGFKKVGSVLSTGGGYVKKWAGKGWDFVVSIKNKFRKPRIPIRVPAVTQIISDGSGKLIKIEKGVPIHKVPTKTPVYRQISGGIGDPNTKKMLKNLENGKSPGDYLPRGGDGATVTKNDVWKYTEGVPPKKSGLTATTTDKAYAELRAGKSKGDLIIEAELPEGTPTFGVKGGMDGESQLLVNKIKSEHITKISRSDGKGGFVVIFKK